MPLLREAGEQLLAVPRELAVAPPRRHVAPELVGLAARVARADDRDLHHLLLEERHAQRPLEDGREPRVRQVDGLLAAAAPQVRVHHAALDGPGAHDGDLDDQSRRSVAA